MILHEYGHAIHSAQGFQFSTEEAGEIWSRALWDIRSALGATKADTAILDGQFGFDGGTMPALARDIVAAADELYGGTVASQVHAVFEDRGILEPSMLQLWKD